MFIEQLIAQIGLPPTEIIVILAAGIGGITMAWLSLRNRRA